MSTVHPFRTLLQREWMQHRTGWLVLMLAPTLLLALLSLFGDAAVQFQINDEAVTGAPPLRSLPPALQTLGWSVGAVGIALVLASLSVLAQLPGLARRDQQDRSVEFWRSLPVSDAQSIGAMVLMHLLLLPGLALATALLGAQLVALLSIAIGNGPLAWLAQPWWALLPTLLALLVRSWLGLLLAVAWLSPLLLLTMAASAWLKRWALPVLLVATLLAVKWLDPRLPMPLVQPALQRLGNEAWQALVPLQAFAGAHDAAVDVATAVPAWPGKLASDGLLALGHALTPAFAAALLVAALGFGLLVLHRRRAE